MTPKEELSRRFDAACASTEITEPLGSKGYKLQLAARRKALSKVRWTLKVANVSEEVFISEKVQLELNPSAWLTSDRKQAAVYTGCDNEDHKLKFFETILGEPLEIVLL